MLQIKLPPSYGVRYRPYRTLQHLTLVKSVTDVTVPRFSNNCDKRAKAAINGFVKRCDIRRLRDRFSLCNVA